jgi:hypothetical protein
MTSLLKSCGYRVGPPPTGGVEHDLKLTAELLAFGIAFGMR